MGARNNIVPSAGDCVNDVLLSFLPPPGDALGGFMCQFLKEPWKIPLC